MFWYFVKLIILLPLVGGMAYGALWLWRKYQPAMLGAMPPEEVRRHMEKADIYLFTSDFNEGWGAVLNESMNSGCAVVASHAIGSVPFLIKNGENGLIYENGNQLDLEKQVLRLLEVCLQNL